MVSQFAEKYMPPKMFLTPPPSYKRVKNTRCNISQRWAIFKIGLNGLTIV